MSKPFKTMIPELRDNFNRSLGEQLGLDPNFFKRIKSWKRKKLNLYRYRHCERIFMVQGNDYGILDRVWETTLSCKVEKPKPMTAKQIIKSKLGIGSSGFTLSYYSQIKDGYSLDSAILLLRVGKSYFYYDKGWSQFVNQECYDAKKDLFKYHEQHYFRKVKSFRSWTDFKAQTGLNLHQPDEANLNNNISTPDLTNWELNGYRVVQLEKNEVMPFCALIDDSYYQHQSIQLMWNPTIFKNKFELDTVAFNYFAFYKKDVGVALLQLDKKNSLNSVIVNPNMEKEDRDSILLFMKENQISFDRYKKSVCWLTNLSETATFHLGLCQLTGPKEKVFHRLVNSTIITIDGRRFLDCLSPVTLRTKPKPRGSQLLVIKFLAEIQIPNLLEQCYSHDFSSWQIWQPKIHLWGESSELFRKNEKIKMMYNRIQSKYLKLSE